MLKNVVVSAVTTIVIMIFGLVGVDTILNRTVEKNINTEVKNISYKENSNENLQIVAEESNSVISTSGVVGIAVKKNSGSKIAKVLDNTWSVGSGCILDSKGYIVTNQHVVGNEKEDIFTTLHGGDTVKGKVIWSNNKLDLAVIKIPVAGLTSIPMGDSDTLRIGEKAIAIGNPLGFDFQGTVTSGIVSGLNRSVEVSGIYMEDLIQTDASINSGNSGGPLMNSKGEVIGINTVKVESAEGIGFAIPINQIKPIVRKIVETGEFKEPYLGILGYDKAMTSYLSSGIRMNTGIYVYSVDFKSPAYNSGIKSGDIILAIDDMEIETLCKLRTVLFSKNIGDKIRVKILRDSEEKEVFVAITQAEV